MCVSLQKSQKQQTEQLDKCIDTKQMYNGFIFIHCTIERKRRVYLFTVFLHNESSKAASYCISYLYPLYVCGVAYPIQPYTYHMYMCKKFIYKILLHLLLFLLLLLLFFSFLYTTLEMFTLLLI